MVKLASHIHRRSRGSGEWEVHIMDDDIRDTERRMASDAEPMMFKVNVFKTFS